MYKWISLAALLAGAGGAWANDERVIFLSTRGGPSRAYTRADRPRYAYQTERATLDVMDAMITECLEQLREATGPGRVNHLALLVAVLRKQWSIAAPDPGGKVPPGLAYLLELSQSPSAEEREVANEGLRGVIDDLLDEALAGRRNPPDPPTRALNAVNWLERIHVPLSVTALNSVAHRAIEPAARIAATRALFTRAGAELNESFQRKLADFCTRALLEL